MKGPFFAVPFWLQVAESRQIAARFICINFRDAC